MNCLQFGFYLRSRRKQLGYSDSHFAIMMNRIDSMKLEAGDNCSLKSLITYLDAVDLCILFEKKETDFGCITFKTNRAKFYSYKFKKDLYTIELEDTYSFFRYINQYELKIRFKDTGDKQILFSKPVYEDSIIWKDISHINSVMRKKIVTKDVSFPALANTLKIKASSLENILYDVLNYDFKIIELIGKKIGCIPIYRTKDFGLVTLEYKNGKLQKGIKNEESGLRTYTDFLSGSKHKVTEVVLALQKIGFNCFIFAKADIPDNCVLDVIKEDNVDATGKRAFHLYRKYELEELIKWRSIGILRNNRCDYCGFRGTVKFYNTKDGRDICLCGYCKDKIHPTNNYVKIIYTPVGGKSR